MAQIFSLDSLDINYDKREILRFLVSIFVPIIASSREDHFDCLFVQAYIHNHFLFLTNIEF